MLMQGTTHRPMRPHRPFVPLLGHSIPKPKEIDAHPSASMRVLLVSCRLTEESVLSHLCEWEYQREDLVQRHLSTNAASEDRTHDLGIMRPTRYQLRYSRLEDLSAVGFLNFSCERAFRVNEESAFASLLGEPQ